MKNFHNPFTDHIDSLALAHEEGRGFVLISRSINCHVEIPCGSADTAARLMQANRVIHFDYDSSLYNNYEASMEFINAAKAIGFEV